MITNEKQYRSTRAAAQRFRKALNAGGPTPDDVDPIIAAAHSNGIRSELEILEAALSEYEDLRDGRTRRFEAESLENLPDILIRARIARGMSQRDLADFIGLKEQQVQRYEAERYRSASLERLGEVAAALGVKVVESGELVGLDGADGPLAASRFPIAEMHRRGWFAGFEGTAAQARKQADILVPAFLRSARPNWSVQAFHRRTARANGETHEAAIAAWEARVLQVAAGRKPIAPFDGAAVDGDWLALLVRLSAHADGVTRAVARLQEVGIHVVLERQLPGMLMDGAALRAADGAPVIALTLRHDRLDNFWFTLLHEVGHVLLHLGRDGVEAIFDDTEAGARSEREREADRFAQEAALPSATWHGCVSRFSRTPRAVLADAERLGVSPAIIAGRIRREAGDYTLLKQFVGAGEVRSALGQAW